MKLHKNLTILIVTMFLVVIAFFDLTLSADQKTFTLDLNNPVFKYEENALNDSNTSKDLTFSTSENITVWIRIPRNSTILSSRINLAGVMKPVQSSTIEQIHDLAVSNVNPSVEYDEIVVGTSGLAYVKLLNNTGSLLWSYGMSSYVYAVSVGNLSADAGEEVVAGDDIKVCIFNSSGSLKGSCYTVGTTTNDLEVSNVNPSVEYDEIAIAADRLYLLDSSYQQLWNYSTSTSCGGIGIGNLSADTGKEVVGGCGNTVYILNSSGGLKNSFTIGTLVTIKDLEVSDILSTEYDEIVVGLNNGTVLLLDYNGNVLWTYSASAAIDAVSVGDVTTEYPGKEIVVGSSDKNVYVLNSSGSFIWSYTTGNEVRGVGVGNLTADPGNEVAAGTNIPATYTLYILNFEYYPTNPSVDVGNNGNYDWVYSGKLRTSTFIPNESITPAVQSYLSNSCTSQSCDAPFVFHSDFAGILNITFINITYDYNASEAISYNFPVSVWSRTNNTFVNETVGNQVKNISYSTPANSIEIRYVRINDTANLCDFGGKQYSNKSIDGINYCNISSSPRNVSSGFDYLWDNNMSADVPISGNETSPVITGAGVWTKNVTIWNQTTTIFYNVTANSSITAGFISDSGLYVNWGGTFYSITPSTATNNCNSTNPTYEIKPIGTDNFYVCKQDVNNDTQIDFFKWKQPHTSITVYIVNGTTNHPPELTNAQVTPSSGKWNITNFNFTVFVNDTDGDNVTVNFWLKINSSNWEMKDSKNISGSGTAWFNYTANKSWVGTNYYMFEYRDFNSTTGYVYHSWQNTSNFTGPTVLRHDISIIYITGNGTSVNRTGSNYTTFSLVVNDTDLNQNVSNANCSFWITTDGINFILANSTSTNSSGFCNFNFDPNVTYSVGQQWWKGGTYQNSYYADTNSTNYTVTIIGGLNINLTESVINQNFTRVSNITLLAKLIDENNNIVTVSGYTCNWYINNTPKPSSTTNNSGYCNYSWQTGCSDSLGVYPINVTLSGSVSPYYIIERNTSNTNITLKDNLNITIINPLNGSIIHEQETLVLNSTLFDSCGAPTESYNVSWYFLKSDACPGTNPVATGPNTTWNLTPACTPRQQIIIANATGDLYNSGKYNTSIYIYGWADVDVKDPLSGRTINRSVVGETYVIICFVKDNLTAPGGIGNYPVNFWYEYSGIEHQIGNNTTVSSGNATYAWDISSNVTIPEGVYTIKCNITDNSTLYYNDSVSEDISTPVYVVGSADFIPPEFVRVWANSTEQYGNVTINANITDLYGVDKVWVNVTYPNSSSFVLNLANTSLDPRKGVWNTTLVNLSDVGDYDFVVYANDTTGNLNSATSWFEVYLPLILKGNITNWDGTQNQTATLTFYRNGTKSVIHRFSTNSSHGYYNLTVHKRLYDLEVKIFGHTILFRDVNTTATANQQFNITNANNITNPLNFTSISHTVIQTPKTINKLVALDVNSILVNRITNITLNYSNAPLFSQIVYEPAVEVFKCSRWTHPQTCNSSWDELGGIPNTNDHTVSINVSNTSVFAAVEAAQCGDGYCHSGESCGEAWYCAADCGACPSGGPTGGPGGVSGGTTPEKEKTISPEMLFSLRTNLTDVQLNPGDEETYALWISNNVNYGFDAYISILGTISNFIRLDKDLLPVDPKTENVTKIYVSIPEGTDPGKYSGQIFVTVQNKTQSLPVTLTISMRGTTLINIVVSALTQRVGVNDTARFLITVYNLGLWKKLYLNLTYSVKDFETEKIVYQEKEGKTVETLTETFVKNIELSRLVDVKPGRYFFRVEARYDNRLASDEVVFEVTKSFWTSENIMKITLVTVLITSVVIIIYGRKQYIIWKHVKFGQETREIFKKSRR